MKFEIKSRCTGEILFSLETETLKLAVTAAVGARADLRGADLRGADLRGADLCGADLCGADLREAKNLKRFPISILGHKHGLYTTMDGKLAIGCHVHTFEEWTRHAEKIGAAEGYSSLDVEIYKLHIAHIEKVSRLLWNQQKPEVAQEAKA